MHRAGRIEEAEVEADPCPRCRGRVGQTCGVCGGSGWITRDDDNTDLSEEQWACVAEFFRAYRLVKSEGVGLMGAARMLGEEEFDPAFTEAYLVFDGEMNRLEHEDLQAERKKAKDGAKQR